MNNQDSPTVFIIDDDSGIRRLVQNHVQSVGLRSATYSSADEFLAVADPSCSGCVVTDVQMPGMSGVELQETLAARRVQLPVIVITAHADVPIAVRAMKAHAVDFLQKPFQREELLERILAAIRIDAERRQDEAERRTASERIAALTTREREVMELLTQGLANKQIAHALDLGEKTIETHRAKLMKKLGVRSVANLVRMVMAAAPRQQQPA